MYETVTMEFTITKEQILEIEERSKKGCINVIQSNLKNWFPEAFKKELATGRWYKYTSNGNIIYCSKIGNDGTLYGYGFMSGQFKVYEDEKSGYCICNSVATKYLIEATDKEVEEALIAEAKKRGFVEGVKTKGFGVYSEKSTLTNGFSYYVNENILKANVSGNFYTKRNIFRDGVWAKPLPEEKTVITKEKALKILAKKLKVSPENIEIQ